MYDKSMKIYANDYASEDCYYHYDDNILQRCHECSSRTQLISSSVRWEPSTVEPVVH